MRKITCYFNDLLLTLARWAFMLSGCGTRSSTCVQCDHWPVCTTNDLAVSLVGPRVVPISSRLTPCADVPDQPSVTEFSIRCLAVNERTEILCPSVFLLFERFTRYMTDDQEIKWRINLFYVVRFLTKLLRFQSKRYLFYCRLRIVDVFRY